MTAMRPSVLIVEDSPSTAHLAKLALSDVSCDIEVAPDAARALELVPRLDPWVMVVDAHLPDLPGLGFLVRLRSEVPGAAMVLLLERGVAVPTVPRISAQLLKPFKPRRLQSIVVQLLHEHDAGRDDDTA